jgi:hypothetical protein
MSSLPTRIMLGFLAGVLSHLIFQGALGASLYAAQLVPSLPWSLAPVPPLGVPRSVSLAFWAGLWGIAYGILEPRLTSLFGRWLGGLVFGLAPLLGHWLIALPLKGRGLGGGFNPAVVPIEVGFHLVFGIGLAVIFWAGLAMAGRIGSAQLRH